MNQPTTAYQHLYNLCKNNLHRNTSTCKQTNKPLLTERVTYIINQLKNNNINLNIFTKNAEMFINVEVFFKGLTNNTRVFIAHHDINNPKSENCNDNSASVSILLDLANQIKNDTNLLIDNVLIVFTDNEEFGFDGARQLANNIKDNKYGNVISVLNLELTAFGTEIWADYDSKDSILINQLEKVVCKDLFKTLYIVNTPPNDSSVLRKQGIDSICIGTLPFNEMEEVVSKKGSYNSCNTWNKCHKENDTFDMANEVDMNNIVELLKLMIN